MKSALFSIFFGLIILLLANVKVGIMFAIVIAHILGIFFLMYLGYKIQDFFSGR